MGDSVIVIPDSPPRTATGGVTAYASEATAPSTRGTGVFDDGDDTDFGLFVDPAPALAQPHQPARHNGLGPPPNCNCGFASILKATESGANYGRQYWACSSTGSTCGFFQWSDPPPAAQTVEFSPVKPYAGQLAVEPPDDDEPPTASGSGPQTMCLCGLPAVQRTSHSQANPERDFMTCPQERGSQCKYFKWLDEMDGTSPNRGGAARGGQKRGFDQVGGNAGGSNAPMCECCPPQPCITLTSNTPANPGRQFYKCAKARDDTTKCGYFKWVDEADDASATGRSFGRGGGGNASKSSRPFGGGGSQNYGGGSQNYGGRPGGGGGGASNSECFKCGQTGHWARDCPTGSGGGARGGGGRFKGGGSFGGGAYGRNPYGKGY